jgi:hypothetical protein
MQKLLISWMFCVVLAMTTDVTGTWTGKVDVGNPGGDPTIPMSLVLTQKGSTLSGTAGDAAHQFPIEKAEIDGDSIKFQLTLGPSVLKFDLRQQEDLLSGTARIQHPGGEAHEGPASFKRK